MRHALEDGGNIAERLQGTIEELTGLRDQLNADVQRVEEQLAVKKSSLQNLEKRISSLAGELKNAQADLAVDQAQVWPSIIVGDGRVGHALKEMGGPSDVTVRSTSELRFQIKNHPAGGPRDGPIYLCVPNKDLADYFAATPVDRRDDLIVLGSGDLTGTLAEHDLLGITEALVYFAVGSRGDQPVDAHLDADRIHDTAYTCCTGKWAPDLAKRLRRNDMGCRVLSRADFEVERTDRLVWTCAVHLIGKLHSKLRMLDVVESHWPELEGMMQELSGAAEAVTGVKPSATVAERFKKYTLSIAERTTTGPIVMKDLPFRNGRFYHHSQREIAAGREDPTPKHTKLLRKIKAVK